MLEAAKRNAPRKHGPQPAAAQPRLRPALIIAIQTLLLIALGAGLGWVGTRLHDQQDYRGAILQASALWTVPFLLCLLVLTWHLPRLLLPKPSHVIATFLGALFLVVDSLQCRPYLLDYLGMPSVTQGIVTDRHHLPAVWDAQNYNIKVNGIWFEQGMSATTYELAQPAACVVITYGVHTLYVTGLSIC